MDSHSIFEELLANQGLSLIVKHISSFLDVKSLAKCRLVNKAWKDLIENHRNWFVYQLDYLRTREQAISSVIGSDKWTIEKSYPGWNAGIQRVSKKLNVPRLKEVTKHLWTYFETEAFGEDPLQDAIENSNFETVQLLIDSGFDLNKADAFGWTPMHYVCAYGNLEMVKLIMKYVPNFDTTRRARCGTWTIFHAVIIKNSDPQVMKLILDTFDFGRDSRLLSAHFKLSYPRTLRFGDVVPHPQEVPILFEAVLQGSIETIQFLFESKYTPVLNFEARLPGGNTILHTVCANRDIEIVDLVYNALVKNNTKINFYTRNEFQSNSLHSACNNTEHADVAFHLLQRFPEMINILGRNDMHVLHYACEFGHLDLIKHIAEGPGLNIDFNTMDQRGLTPLHFASHYGQYDIVKFLLDQSKALGIDIEKKSNSHRTAEDFARQSAHKNILDLFEIKRGLNSCF